MPSLSIGEQVEYKIRDGLLEIGELDFSSPFSRSPNGRFVLTWWDGVYLLLESNRVVATGKELDAGEGKVANNGNFILNGGTGKPDLGGLFYALAASGQILIRKRFRANLDKNGLSDGGRFAFCETLRSDYKAHSDRTFVFDLEAKALLSNIDCWGVGPESLDCLEGALRLNPKSTRDMLVKSLKAIE